MKSPTVKDVLYAMEYLDEKLVGRHRLAGTTGGTQWRLSKSRKDVTERVAEEACRDPHVVNLPAPLGFSKKGWQHA
jgi:hypothetical protein